MNSVYPDGVACPECLGPTQRNRADGRCETCLYDKKVLPVNFKRRPKKKTDDEDEYSYDEKPRRRERD